MNQEKEFKLSLKASIYGLVDITPEQFESFLKTELSQKLNELGFLVEEIKLREAKNQ